MKAAAGFRLLVIGAALAVAAGASGAADAHPAWGIVQDRAGNVFYSDTESVWCITPADRVVAAVPHVHTHELSLDAAGNLYGEHLWYDGAQPEPWGHRVWRRAANGRVEDIIPARRGFRRDYGFVRDGRDVIYWAEHGAVTTIRRRDPDGRVRTHCAGPFRSLERLTARPDGTLYLLDAGDLRRVSPAGEITTLVRGLTGRSSRPDSVAALNYHMGLWTDPAGAVYVAAASERRVLRVDAAGAVHVVDKSPLPWAPAGGLTDAAGRLWVLEYDPGNAMRVRRVGPDGPATLFVAPAARPTGTR